MNGEVKNRKIIQRKVMSKLVKKGYSVEELPFMGALNPIVSVRVRKPISRREGIEVYLAFFQEAFKGSESSINPKAKVVRIDKYTEEYDGSVRKIVLSKFHLDNSSQGIIFDIKEGSDLQMRLKDEIKKDIGDVLEDL